MTRKPPPHRPKIISIRSNKEARPKKPKMRRSRRKRRKQNTKDNKIGKKDEMVVLPPSLYWRKMPC